jgi:hypothetical protein
VKPQHLTSLGTSNQETPTPSEVDDEMMLPNRPSDHMLRSGELADEESNYRKVTSRENTHWNSGLSDLSSFLEAFGRGV